MQIPDSENPGNKNEKGCAPSSNCQNVQSPSVAGSSKSNTNNDLEESGINAYKIDDKNNALNLTVPLK